MTNKKVAVIGTHGVGKSTICKKVFQNIKDNIRMVNETFRNVLNNAKLSSEQQKKQNESMTLATYGYQIYQEHLFNLQSNNIISDRSAVDCMIYNDYYSKALDKYSTPYLYAKNQALFHTKHFYDKVYLIEPSDRLIDNDNFRLTDKKSQQDIHNLFLRYLKDFKNVILVNQEEQNNVIQEITNFLK